MSVSKVGGLHGNLNGIAEPPMGTAFGEGCGGVVLIDGGNAFGKILGPKMPDC